MLGMRKILGIKYVLHCCVGGSDDGAGGGSSRVTVFLEIGESSIIGFSGWLGVDLGSG